MGLARTRTFARNSFTIDKSLKWPVVCGGGQDSNRRASGIWETTNFSCMYKKEEKQQRIKRREKERKSIFVLFTVGGGAKIFGMIFEIGAMKTKREQNRDELGTKSDRERYEMLLLLQCQ